MNKNDLIDTVAAQLGVGKAEAGRTVDAILDAVTEALKAGQEVRLSGFGTFAVSKRAARTGRNPATGATINIAAASVPKFRAAQALKPAVGGSGG
jgi:DNA-binding protein HU-beta